MGQDLFSLRDYQPQDDLRHIDWKATARSRNLTVREFTAEDERRITLVLDTRDLSDGQSENFLQRFERGVVQIASLLNHFITERAEVRLVLGPDIGTYGEGLKHLYAGLRRLAVVIPQRQFSGGQFLSNESEAEDAVFQDYAVVVTTAKPGSIPSKIWRASHVMYV